MIDRAAKSLVPAFLVACLMFGGASREGHFANMVLQLAGVALATWGLYALDRKDLRMAETTLLGLGIFAVAIVAAQLIPISFETWRSLPGRAVIAAELDLLGVIASPAFVTFSAQETVRSAASLLPAFGIVLALIAAPSIPARQLAVTLVGFGLATLAVGIAQVLGPDDSVWYFYDFTNRGFMVGFFANANHMATLLLVTLPFLAALVSEGRARFPTRRSEVTILGVALLALIAIGIGLVGSLTGYALLLPVTLASALIIWPLRTPKLSVLLIVPALLASAGILFLAGDAENAFAPDLRNSMVGREAINSNAMPAAQDFFPVGSGLGTFEEVYRRYVDEREVGRSFVNHAHNDYLEVVVETGVPGLVLVGLFLVWWLFRLKSLFGERASPYTWASWITIGVILVHSGWDYPLRTSALAAVFALSCAIMAKERPAPTANKGWKFTPSGKAPETQR